MEEKIKKMEVKKNESNNEKVQKLSYEQLENVARQLTAQNQQLINRMRMADNMFKRLDYLFKVVENSTVFSSEFVTKCTEEIEDMITLPEEEEDNTEDTKE